MTQGTFRIILDAFSPVALSFCPALSDTFFGLLSVSQNFWPSTALSLLFPPYQTNPPDFYSSDPVVAFVPSWRPVDSFLSIPPEGCRAPSSSFFFPALVLQFKDQRLFPQTFTTPPAYSAFRFPSALK